MTESEFLPRWASPPGDTIREALRARHLAPSVLAEALELAPDELDGFLAGDCPLTIRRAERLCSTIGGSVEFWMARDSQYRDDLERVDADAWAQQMPLKEMARLGWVTVDSQSWTQQIDACLDFFAVATPSDWKLDYTALIGRARFRSSPASTMDEFAVAAWLRQCEVELSEVSCGQWDHDAFEALLPQLLVLTRERDPRQFLVALQARCAEVGVAVAVVRAPRGCPVSGAARQLANGQPSIALSGRYLADDHFWFTFFHEAAHLLLHGADRVYLDDIELMSKPPQSADELEADEYAGALLVPKEFEGRLAKAKDSALEFRRVANEIGVGLGIVVGQVQHRRILGYNTRYNHLKNRYRWDGPNLEKA